MKGFVLQKGYLFSKKGWLPGRRLSIGVFQGRFKRIGIVVLFILVCLCIRLMCYLSFNDLFKSVIMFILGYILIALSYLFYLSCYLV